MSTIAVIKAPLPIILLLLGCATTPLPNQSNGGEIEVLSWQARQHLERGNYDLASRSYELALGLCREPLVRHGLLRERALVALVAGEGNRFVEAVAALEAETKATAWQPVDQYLVGLKLFLLEDRRAPDYFAAQRKLFQ